MWSNFTMWSAPEGEAAVAFQLPKLTLAPERSSYLLTLFDCVPPLTFANYSGALSFTLYLYVLMQRPVKSKLAAIGVQVIVANAIEES